MKDFLLTNTTITNSAKTILHTAAKVALIEIPVIDLLVKYQVITPKDLKITIDNPTAINDLKWISTEAAVTAINDMKWTFTKAATAGYLIRSIGKIYQDDYAKIVGEETAKNFPLSYYTGVLGGAVRYYLLGKEYWELGAINNLAYEVCNNYDFCSKSPLVSTIATISIETIDLFVTNYLEGTLSLETAPIIAIQGVTIGISVSLLANFAYVPTHMAIDKATDYMELDSLIDMGINQTPTDVLAGNNSSISTGGAEL